MGATIIDCLYTHCTDSIGDDLRAMYTYSDEHGIEPEYIRDDLEHRIEDLSRDVLHNPFWGLHRAAVQAATILDHIGPPEASLFQFQHVLLFTFPTSTTGGVIVAVENNEHYISTLFPELAELVSKSDTTSTE